MIADQVPKNLPKLFSAAFSTYLRNPKCDEIAVSFRNKCSILQHPKKKGGAGSQLFDCNPDPPKTCGNHLVSKLLWEVGRSR